MKRVKKNILAPLMCASAAALLSLSASAADTRPNILIFYVDDLGWQGTQLNDVDTPCAYETPNVLKLAEKGMNFTQAYSSAPTCAPSRAGINTGRHPGKLHYTHVTFDRIPKMEPTAEFVDPFLGAHLDLDVLTMATAMADNGYATGHVGKWHLGLSSSLFGYQYSNEDRGVHRKPADRTKGFATAKDSKYPLSKEKYAPFSKKKPEGISYPLDTLTESALEFMGKSDDKPFFLYMAHWMVHWPAVTRNGELLEYYCDKLGQPFPPKEGAQSTPGQNNPYFASMVSTIDWSLGRVVDFLEKTDDPRSPGKKLIETTYIFFSSDNGGALMHGEEVLSDNTPLKYGKVASTEGGIRVPMIVTGPGIPTASQFDGMVNQLDYFPTILELTDSTIAPEDAKELSGLDITPVLLDGAEQIVDAQDKPRENLFWHFPHDESNMKSTLRDGDYKLYKNYTTHDYSLTRLYKDGKRADLEEMTDLALDPEYAPMVEKLAEKLERYLEENDVEGPYLNPLYKGKTIPSADIQSAKIDPVSRVAHVVLKKTSPKIVKASVIYQKIASNGKAKSKSELRAEKMDVRIGVKHPVEISKDGMTVSAKIPADIGEYCFLLIDENNYQTFTSNQKKQKKQKKKK